MNTDDPSSLVYDGLIADGGNHSYRLSAEGSHYRWTILEAEDDDSVGKSYLIRNETMADTLSHFILKDNKGAVIANDTVLRCATCGNVREDPNDYICVECRKDLTPEKS